MPGPRSGSRQKTCGRAECQRERHRRYCRRWHRHNSDYDRDRRLRERLLREETKGTIALSRVNPMARLDESVARDVVGLEVSVYIDVFWEVLLKWLRDVVEAETESPCGFARRLMPPGLRDVKDAGLRPP